MAAPNLRDPAAVIGKTVGFAVTTTLTEVLANPAASNKVYRINAAYCANVDGAQNAEITFLWRRGGTDVRLAFELVVPAKATQVLVAREAYLYLEEGDSFRARANVSGDLELTISYEDIG